MTTLVAFVNAIALVVITILIVWEAIERFPHSASGRGRHDDGHCRGWAAGKYTFFLVTSSRQRREKPQRESSGTGMCSGTCWALVGAIIAALIIIWTGWTPADPILSILVSKLWFCVVRGDC
ncbi:cation transporter [Escherichia coli]|nr:cation transporter [Escherichia coli]